MRACDRWERVRQLDSPIGWTFRVGANLANSWFRRRAAARRARRRHGPDRTVHRNGNAADRMPVDRALQAVTDQQRRAVVLRYFLGLSAPEAAEVMDTTAGAVRALTHRAVVALRDELDVDLQETTDAT